MTMMHLVNDMREEEIKCRTGDVRNKYMYASLNRLSYKTVAMICVIIMLECVQNARQCVQYAVSTLQPFKAAIKDYIY